MRFSKFYLAIYVVTVLGITLVAMSDRPDG